MFSIKTILHPTNFSAAADAAFQCACSLASKYGAQLVVVHVTSISASFGTGPFFPNAEQGQQDGNEELFAVEVPDEHVDLLCRMERGKPAAEILYLARLYQADLIVMGTDGRHSVKKRLVGHVTDEVLREASCPVLAVRASEQEEILADHRAAALLALKCISSQA